MNFLKYLQLPIFLIAFHFNASIHHRLHPSSLPTLAAIYRRTINFRREKRFLMHIAASYCWRWFKILYRHFCKKVRCREETIQRSSWRPCFHPCSDVNETGVSHSSNRSLERGVQQRSIRYCKDFSLLSSLHFTAIRNFVSEFDDNLVHFFRKIRFS